MHVHFPENEQQQALRFLPNLAVARVDRLIDEAVRKTKQIVLNAALIKEMEEVAASLNADGTAKNLVVCPNYNSITFWMQINCQEDLDNLASHLHAIGYSARRTPEGDAGYSAFALTSAAGVEVPLTILVHRSVNASALTPKRKVAKKGGAA
ncbi:hypothetical protein [Chitinimonas koreensis]|uniref:hypothetical protein n=1 Tax=Chitinimonas koreensis TaxID=356302 RepID=UPI0016542D48|nr:hypothetical protein [Chitinimonas koreensis]QNM94922.1 hypothetical protein H9L41_13430 [Chitinimonas koreensis]